MSNLPQLIVLPVSPWSERARWALDHHHLPYRVIVHEPFIGERRLRRLVGAHKPRATVPILIDGDCVLSESWDIVAYADRRGSASKLIPEGREPEVRSWVALADQSMAGGRALVVSAMLHSPQALDESAPPPLPHFLRPAIRPLTRFGTRWFARKYGLSLDDLATPKRALQAGLVALREGLGTSSPYLLGSFSFADIAMATLLQGILPVHSDSLPLGPATRQAWTQPSLAHEFADLVAWRDELYRKHRP